MKRFFAWAGILIIAAVFLALIVLTFTGGPENVILALLFCVTEFSAVLMAIEAVKHNDYQIMSIQEHAKQLFELESQE